MKASQWNRQIHRWGAIVTALPVLVVLITGLLLQLKKQSAWIQPKTQTGADLPPSIAFDRVLAIVQSVPDAGVDSWADIDRIDVRPSKGILKVRCENRLEVQLDASSGAVLQVAVRRSDVIESLHDGSFFSDAVKLAVFLPSAIVLLALWGTGVYLFFLPQLVRRRNRRRAISN